MQSVGRQVPVSGRVGAVELPPVWKIFSEEKVSEAQLDQMFPNRSQVRRPLRAFKHSSLVYLINAFTLKVEVFEWLAYPRYLPDERPKLASFVLSPRLYYVNAVEFAASAMEMSAIAAVNVANLAFADWTGKLANVEQMVGRGGGEL